MRITPKGVNVSPKPCVKYDQIEEAGADVLPEGVKERHRRNALVLRLAPYGRSDRLRVEPAFVIANAKVSFELLEIRQCGFLALLVAYPSVIGHEKEVTEGGFEVLPLREGLRLRTSELANPSLCKTSVNREQDGLRKRSPDAFLLVVRCDFILNPEPSFKIEQGNGPGRSDWPE